MSSSPISALQAENFELRSTLENMQENEKNAIHTVARYFLLNIEEQQALQSKIKFLKDQVQQLTSELQIYQKKDEDDDRGQLQLDDNGDIKAGTLEKLTETLYVDNNFQASEYGNVFLMTYRSFANSGEILELLIIGYSRFTNNSADAMKCRLRIGNFLKKWITEDFYDFIENSETLDRYKYFINEIIAKCDPKLAETIKQTLEQRLKGVLRRFTSAMFSCPAPQSLIPRSSQFSDFPPLEIARQLTISDYNMCKAIEPREFLGLAWTKKDKDKRSPNLLKMINQFNMVGKWVSFMLVSEPTIKKRSKLLSHLIVIMQHLRELNNFNAIFQIIGGLGNASVHRLAKTFALLKPEKKRILEELQVLTNPHKSWSNYRKTIHEVNPPCVPFFGVYQTDLTFIEDGNPDKFSNGLINFKKCRLIAGVIEEIQQYQQKPYNLSLVPMIADTVKKLIEDAQCVDDRKLYELSMQAEPREE